MVKRGAGRGWMTALANGFGLIAGEGWFPGQQACNEGQLNHTLTGPAEFQAIWA